MEDVTIEEWRRFADSLYCKVKRVNDAKDDACLPAIKNAFQTVLTERERVVVWKRHFIGMTIQAISEEYHVKRSRIRSIAEKAYRKLRRPDNCMYFSISDTQNNFLKLQEENKELKKLNARLMLDIVYLKASAEANGCIIDNKNLPDKTNFAQDRISVEHIEISARLLNALIRNRTCYLDEVAAIPPEDIFRLRNIGKMSLIELINVMRKYSFNEWANDAELFITGML